MNRFQVVISILLVFIMSGCVKIQPQEGGVRTNFIILKGIRPKPLSAGLYLNISSVTEVASYSIMESKYEMTKETATGDEAGRDDIMLRSKDGQVVWFDCTVLYRLIPEKLPVLHQVFGKEYIKNAIRPIARALVSYKFGELSAEEIYEGKNREQIGNDIRDMMNNGFQNITLPSEGSEIAKMDTSEGLKAKGIEILYVLFRDFEFTPEYQQAIESKRLAAEQRLAAIEIAKKKEAEAEGDKMAMLKRAEGEAGKVKQEADADLYLKQQQAKGIEAMGLAEAKSKEALSKALGGGETIVQLEFAKNLSERMQVWGIPTGSNSTSFMDLSGLFSNMFPRAAQSPATTSQPAQKSEPPQNTSHPINPVEDDIRKE